MFGFLKTEQVVPTAYRDGILTFSCMNKYKVGKTIKVKLTLQIGSQIIVPKVAVTVVDVEVTPEGTVVCSGALQERAKNLPALEMQFAMAGLEGACRRRTPRLGSTIRILSRELANFRATTTNVNLHGAELLCDGPVSDGTLITLQLDLERVGHPELTMQAVSIWSQEVEIDRVKKYRVGVSFTNLSSLANEAWTTFYKELSASQGASIMMKTMGGTAAELAPRDIERRGEPDFSEHEAPPLGSDPNVSLPPVPSASEKNMASQPVAERKRLSLGNSAQGGSPTSAPPFQPSGGGAPSFPASGGAPAFQVPGSAAGSAPPFPVSGSSPGSAPSFQAPGSSPTGAPSFQPPGGSPGAPSFQIPGSSSGAPSFQPPGGPSSFQPPGGPSGAPSFQPPGGSSSAPSFQPPGGSSGAPSFQPPGGSSGAPSFQIPGSSSGAPSFQPPSGPSGAPSFQPPGGSSGAPSFPIPGGSGAPSFQPPGGSSGTPSFQIPGSTPNPTSFRPPGTPGQFQPPAAKPAPFQMPSQPNQGGFQVPGSQPPRPEPVEPLSISGPQMTFRCRQGSAGVPGTKLQVQLSFNLDGRTQSVPVTVSILSVEPAQDGTCISHSQILEEQQKIAVLNQLIGKR